MVLAAFHVKAMKNGHLIVVAWSVTQQQRPEMKDNLHCLTFCQWTFDGKMALTCKYSGPHETQLMSFQLFFVARHNFPIKHMCVFYC